MRIILIHNAKKAIAKLLSPFLVYRIIDEQRSAASTIRNNKPD